MPLLIALAGGMGAASRFVIDGLLRTVVGRIFPWSTIIINISGSLLLGVVTGIALHHASTDIKLIWGTGFCGGYTTFSTASYETVRLIEERRYVASLGYAVVSFVLAVSFFAIGFLMT